MASHPFSTCLFLWLVFYWKETTCSAGEGMRVWEQPKQSVIAKDQSFLYDTFPSGFLWGSGTSAFQTEGAWDQDWKGASIWDHFTHLFIGGNSSTKTANVASDSYNLWKEDVAALDYLGVKAYTFSLSWPRIFPDGDPSGEPSKLAVEHYRILIKSLLKKNIEPIVMLYHSDLPQVLQEKHGGWKNDTLVGLFEKYAIFCFRTFGNDVRYWLTMHNPYLVAVQGYGTGVHAPGEKGGMQVSLTAAHNLIKAHARAWQAYNTLFRTTQKGKVSIVLGSHWVEPHAGQATASNIALCQQSIEAVLGWFANPIFGNGDYPTSLKIKHGHLMPVFTQEEKLWVEKTADFFALSFGPYNLRLGKGLVHNGQIVTPDMRQLLSWINLEYGNPNILVAEGGWFSEASVGKEDTVAIYLMKSFINQALQAIKLDGVQVFGYTAWSLVDGFEWNYAYSIRRGLFYVDFNHPNRTRTPKTSAQYYRHLIAENGFPSDENSVDIKGHFPCKFHWGVADSILQVHFYPFSPQFTDPQLYSWNLTGDGSLHAVPGVKLRTRPAQCSDYLAIRDHLRLFASTGASHYRFALNWSLILPEGDRSHVNSQVLRYYRCVLMELKKLELEALVIMYYPTHSSSNMGLPESLHSSGGWLKYSTVEAFQEYAKLCYQELGPWVKYWITINEPNRLIDVFSNEAERHQAAHNLLLAHAKVWRLYEKEHYHQQQGLVSLALHADWAKPANPYLESHTVAAERFLLFELGRFLEPLVGAINEAKQTNVEHPHGAKEYLKEKKQKNVQPDFFLPSFTESERQELRGALSFIALNHFTTRLVSPHPHTKANFQKKSTPDHDCLILTDPTWPSSSMGQALVPWGLREVLRWVSERYGRALPIIITGSGIDDLGSSEDELRQHYIKSYIQEALKAYHIDKINLQGFYIWKLQDRHVPQYGLFTSTQYQSQAKASVGVYREIITHSGFPSNDNVKPCKFDEQSDACSMCEWVFKNKAMLIFGICVLMTAVILAATIAFVIVTKRNQRQDRGRLKSRLNWRRKKERAPMCVCPVRLTQ